MNRYRLCLDNECERFITVTHENLEEYMSTFAWI